MSFQTQIASTQGNNEESYAPNKNDIAVAVNSFLPNHNNTNFTNVNELLGIFSPYTREQ